MLPDDAPRLVASAEPASAAARDVALVRWHKVLDGLLRLSARDAPTVVAKAIEHAKAQLGEVFGVEGRIDYAAAATGEGPRGAELVLHALVGQMGLLAGEPRSMQLLTARWLLGCREADRDGSGSISEADALTTWERLLADVVKSVQAKVALLDMASEDKMVTVTA